MEIEIPKKQQCHVSITQREGDSVVAKYAWTKEHQECYSIRIMCHVLEVSNLKVEWIYPNGIYKTRREAELSIVEYIEMFYNSR